MPARPDRRRWGLAVVAVLAAACSSTTAPQAHLANPQQLSSDLQAVSGVLQSWVLASFGVVGSAAGPPATVATPAGAPLDAAPLPTPQPPGRAYHDAPRRPPAPRTA